MSVYPNEETKLCPFGADGIDSIRTSVPPPAILRTIYAAGGGALPACAV